MKASGLKILLPFFFFCILLSQRLLLPRRFHLFPSINLLPASSVHQANTRRENAWFLSGSTSSCVPVSDVLGAYGCRTSVIHHQPLGCLKSNDTPLHWETKRSYVGICGAFTPELQLNSDSDSTFFVGSLEETILGFVSFRLHI